MQRQREMGCKSSRIEETDVVSLCRERRELIAAAVERRYALAAAHAAYFDALASVGDALQRFVQEELTVASSSLPPGSPVLTIPSPDEKGNTKTFGHRSAALAAAASVSSSATPLSHALSINGSHLPLSSIGRSEVYHDSLSEHGGSGAHGGGDLSSPPNQHVSYSIFNSSFLKSSMEIPQTVYQDPFASPWSNSLYNGYGFDYPPYGVPIGLSTPSRDEKFGPSTPPVAPATPPPPSPVKTSGWEFFDPFNTYEHFVNHYSQGKLRTGSLMSSPDFSEVRKQEGIPDLEWDAEPKKEAKKEKIEGKKENVVKNDLRDKGSGNAKKLESLPAKDSERRDEKNHPVGLGKEGRKDSWASSKGKSGGEDEDWKRGRETFDKNSSVTEGSAPPGGKSSSSASSGQSFFLHTKRDVVDVVKEVKKHFHSAADCGEEVSRMLEVDKFPYHSRSRRFGDIRSRIWDPIAMPVLISSGSFMQPQPINLSTLDENMGKENLDNGIIQKSRSLSTTLEKLNLWEDKLYKEVKDEEKLRIIYDKKYKELKSLVSRGAETSKIEMTRTSVRELQTKISVIIRSVNSISNRMHMIRDKELMPQLTELIQGLIRMWKTVLNCHQKQLKAIVSSKIHKLVVKTGSQSETVARTTKELELELLNWYRCFNNLIVIQKSYIEALNGWLISWLPQEDEVTPDGVAPFSPSQIGAPAVFVLSNDWYHANKIVSGKQVAEAMHAFIAVLQFLSEAQKEEHRRRLEAEYFSGTYDKVLESLLQKGESGNLDIESSTKDGLEHNDNGGMMKLEMLRKRLDEKMIKHEETLKRIKSVTSIALQSCLAPLFEELEIFTSETLRAYDCLRIPNGGIVVQEQKQFGRQFISSMRSYEM